MNALQLANFQLATALAVIALFGWQPVAAADRDEAAAREYVYCGRIVAAWEVASEVRGQTEAARGLRNLRSYFVMAATLRSDPEFMQQEIKTSSQRFKERFPGKDVPAENKELEAEGDRCSNLLVNEVKPLLGLK